MGGHFAKEALDELVDLITKPGFMNKIVIVLAGYEAEIESLMTSNPGLSSRFAEKVFFKSLSPTVSCDMLLAKLKKAGFIVDDFASIKAEAEQVFTDLQTKTNGWVSNRVFIQFIYRVTVVILRQW